MYFKKKNTKNFLRIYANAGKENYTPSDKEAISELFISIAKDLLDVTKLNYDISGSGYGISKGDSCFGEKSYRNRLLKKGYDAMWGMRVGSDWHNYASNFMLMGEAHPVQHMDCSFYWSLESDTDMDYALEILKRISSICTINYAYAYPAKESITLGEWHIKRSLFSISSKKSKIEQKWKTEWVGLLDGKIKKLYPINCFNPVQLKNLETIQPNQRVNLKNKLEYWKLSTKEIVRGNSTLENIIIREK